MSVWTRETLSHGSLGRWKYTALGSYTAMRNCMDWVGSGCSIFVRVCRLEMPFGMRSSRERRRGKDYRRWKAHRMQGVECGLITRRVWFLVFVDETGEVIGGELRSIM